MRLVRVVLGGIVLGAVGGYVAALLRPRTVHGNPAADVAADVGVDTAPLPERVGGPASADPEVPYPVEVRR
ncbi:MAG TPA: hypothetical protein VMT69_10170 [Kineosporiaceae bacterium]|nr:hypothetical protein [Kineosporiaceae bacterium]